jgi:prephenate dehydrogenase
MPQAKRVAIIGLGLIGGSLGLAIRRRRAAREVVGFSRRQATVARAKSRGAIDRSAASLRQAVLEADLVVLAGPVDTIVPLGRQAARFMKPGAVLTDVGSTKAAIVRGLGQHLPRGIAFVGGHPIAGSEQQGIDAANAGLFAGAVCMLTPTARTPRAALKRVRALWERIGARVQIVSPAAHDQLLAMGSHLPHLLAAVLMQTAQGRLPRPAPCSFLDMTRIALSSPELWDDIFLSNRVELLAAMRVFARQWQQWQRLLSRRQGAALRQQLHRAQRARKALTR